jgi:hypothetical protein
MTDAAAADIKTRLRDLIVMPIGLSKTVTYGNFNQGNFNQGNFNQGNFSPDTLTGQLQLRGIRPFSLI